jgi:hypothetical protein
MAFILDVGSNGVWKPNGTGMWGYATGLRRPICLQANWRIVFAQLEGHLKFGNTSTFQIGKGTPGAPESVGFSMSSTSTDISLSLSQTKSRVLQEFFGR